jgi:hypothetical protein
MFQSPPKCEPPLTTSSRLQSISTIKQSKVGRSKEWKGMKGRKKKSLNQYHLPYRQGESQGVQQTPYTTQMLSVIRWGRSLLSVHENILGNVSSPPPQPKTGCGRSSSFIQQCRSYFHKMQMSACKATDSHWPKHRLSAWLNTHHDKRKTTSQWRQTSWRHSEPCAF